MQKQTWKIAITNRQRWLLVNKILPLQPKTRKDQTVLRRVRLALGLMVPTEVLLEEGRVASAPIKDKSPCIVDVTGETKDYILEHVVPTLSAADLAIIDPVLMALEDEEDTDAEGPRYDEDIDRALWTPPQAKEKPPEERLSAALAEVRQVLGELGGAASR